MTDTISVLGISGYVGAHMAAVALAKGFNVKGGLRHPDNRDTSWLDAMAAQTAKQGACLTLHHYEIGDAASTGALLDDTIGVICSAGTEKQEPATTDIMMGLAESVCDAAITRQIPAVFTSSTGSTNPPGGDPELKNEIDHWSDEALQIEQGKHAPLGKTRLDKIVLAKSAADEGFRGVTINPSMICGPCWQAEPVRGLKRYAQIIKGEVLNEKVPNGSMSMIDARDLAELHIAALLNPEAEGRYFGLKQSWHWRDILAAIKKHVPEYVMPPIDETETPVRPTAFDTTRRDSLGVNLRGLDEIMKAHIDAIRAHGLI